MGEGYLDAIRGFLRWLQEEREVQLADVVPFGQYVPYYPHDSVAVDHALYEYYKSEGEE